MQFSDPYFSFLYDFLRTGLKKDFESFIPVEELPFMHIIIHNNHYTEQIPNQSLAYVCWYLIFVNGRGKGYQSKRSFISQKSLLREPYTHKQPLLELVSLCNTGHLGQGTSVSEEGLSAQFFAILLFAETGVQCSISHGITGGVSLFFFLSSVQNQN